MGPSWGAASLQQYRPHPRIMPAQYRCPALCLFPLVGFLGCLGFWGCPGILLYCVPRHVFRCQFLLLTAGGLLRTWQCTKPCMASSGVVSLTHTLTQRVPPRVQGPQAAAAAGLRRDARPREQHQLRAPRGGAGHAAGAVRRHAQRRLHHLRPLQGRARRVVCAGGACFPQLTEA